MCRDKKIKVGYTMSDVMEWNRVIEMRRGVKRDVR
jgi:hypothetical protein